jgi:hypothetical protein
VAVGGGGHTKISLFSIIWRQNFCFSLRGGADFFRVPFGHPSLSPTFRGEKESCLNCNKIEHWRACIAYNRNKSYWTIGSWKYISVSFLKKYALYRSWFGGRVLNECYCLWGCKGKSVSITFSWFVNTSICMKGNCVRYFPPTFIQFLLLKSLFSRQDTSFNDCFCPAEEVLRPFRRESLCRNFLLEL